MGMAEARVVGGVDHHLIGGSDPPPPASLPFSLQRRRLLGEKYFLQSGFRLNSTNCRERGVAEVPWGPCPHRYYPGLNGLWEEGQPGMPHMPQGRIPSAPKGRYTLMPWSGVPRQINF